MIDRLADRILRITADHPVRVCVDGPSAAGKTTLANRLAEELRGRTGRAVIRAELDYFMKMVEDRNAYPYDSPESYYLDAWDYPGIRSRLLEPLGPGGNRRYLAALGADERVAPDDAILLADGVFLQRPELDPYWDLRIYLHIGAAESLRRGVVRDQAWMGGPVEAERRYRTKYLPGEQRYQAEVRPRERAHIVIDNS
ncbi:MAG TPA: uridylate kinase [Actinoplanes sp.]|nr:uridylate kinase [Actinoplanes sp.]